MWIIPKNHPLSSAFAQDTVESKEELSEHLEDQLTHSLMSRSKIIPLKTWCRRWKTDSSVPALFGRTLKPSQQKRFEEELTSLLEDTRANRFLLQGKDSEKTTQDTYGPTLPKLYEVSVHEWSSLKTSKDISTEDSKKFAKTWKSLVTKRRGEYSQRVKQAHLIREKESLSSENYPTPRVGGQGFNASEAKGHSPNLEITVILKDRWATPNTFDAIGLRSDEALYRQATTTRKGRTKPANLREQVDPNSCEIYKAASQGLSWPTATASDPEGGPQKDRVELTDSGFKLRKKGKEHMTYGDKLRDAVEFHEDRNWPTVLASDYKRRGPNSKQQGLPELMRNLEDRNFPTPCASEEKYRLNGDSQASKCLSAVYRRESLEKGENGHLNPSWVESLMGLPQGWTQLGTLSVEDWKGWPSRPGQEQFDHEAPRTLPKGDEGLDNRTDRLRMLGNGVVPQTAEIAVEVLSEQLMEM